MGTFSTLRLNTLQVPLNGPLGIEWSNVLGGAQDGEFAALRTAGRLRSVTKAPDDGLDNLGSLYQLARAPRENYTGEPGPNSYRGRLGNAWPFWQSAPGLAGLAGLFEVLHGPGLWHPAVCLSAYAANPALTWFSEVFFLLPVGLASDGTWGANDFDGQPSLYGDGGLWGISYTPDNPYAWWSFGIADLDWLKRQIRLCKGAQAYPVWIAAATALDSSEWSAMWGDSSAADVPGTFGDGGNWGDPAPSSVLWLCLGHVWGEEQWYGGGPGLWGDPGDAWEVSFEPPSGGW